MENPSCFLYGPGISKIENSPYPSIQDEHDVVLNIAFVGVCGSDVGLIYFPKTNTNDNRSTSGTTEAL